MKNRIHVTRFTDTTPGDEYTAIVLTINGVETDLTPQEATQLAHTLHTTAHTSAA